MQYVYGIDKLYRKVCNPAMKYLLYIRNGFIKKYPFEKKTILLGRGPDSDLFIDESFISKSHARIKISDQFIEVEDLGSKNGIFKDGSRVEKVKAELDESFQIGHMEFFLKEGNAQEFELSEDARLRLKKTAALVSNYNDETKTSLNLFDKALVITLQMGFKIRQFEDILKKARVSLTNTLNEGSLYVVSGEKGKIKILSELHLDNPIKIDFEKIHQQSGSFKRELKNIKMDKKNWAYSFPIKLQDNPAALIYVVKSHEGLPEKVLRFLRDLSKEISIIYKLVEHNRRPFHPDKVNDSAIAFITKNQSLIRVFEKCKKMAKSDLFLLIEGETGVGKEVLAKFIHHHSGLSKEKYIGINCSAIPEPLLENELFGHEKGAFTGAKSQQPGKLELASGGTLVLDEIGDMPLNLQAKLLRALQEKEFYRIGGSHPIKVDLRIISLTHKNLKELIKQKNFREDLYYRIAHYKVKIPPLRKRKEDIVPLLNHFLEEFTKKYDVFVKGFSKQAAAAMQEYNWPGNVRELENQVRSLVNQADDGDMIDFYMLDDDITGYRQEPPDWKNEEGSTEKEKLMALLEKHRWNKSRVARELNVTRMTLYKKMGKYDINP